MNAAIEIPLAYEIFRYLQQIFFGTRQMSTGTQSFKKQNDATNAHKTTAMMSANKEMSSTTKRRMLHEKTKPDLSRNK